MKKYRLKQWYPSLLKDIRVGDIITENGQHYKGVTYKCIGYRVEIWQLHPDFWELVEEPLFITEDGADVCRGVKTWAVDINTFKKAGSGIHNGQAPNYKYFIHESNADEYIWRNKKVFSYNDLRSWAINGGTQEEALKVAKERSKP